MTYTETPVAKKRGVKKTIKESERMTESRQNSRVTAEEKALRQKESKVSEVKKAEERISFCSSWGNEERKREDEREKWKKEKI